MSNLSELLPAGAGAKSAEFVASGTLGSGVTVALKADGTVEAVAAVAQSAGSPVVFESANVQFVTSTFDSNSNKVVIAYRDLGNSIYGTAIVGTVSGTNISFGTAVVFQSSTIDYTSITFDSTLNKVVIAYRNEGNSDYGTAIVGTVSGTSISFGTPVVFASSNSVYESITYDSINGKVVIAYANNSSSSRGTAIVGTVSGTSISFGSATVFESTDSSFISATYDSTNGKIVIAYRDYVNSEYGTAIVGTVSGTSISFGAASVFESAATIYIATSFDSTNNKVVIVYRDVGNADSGTAVVGTVSGTSISFGTAVSWTGDSSYYSATYDVSAGKIVISYRDDLNSGYGTVVSATVSGTSISFDTPLVFEAASVSYTSAVFDSNANKVAIAYRDVGNSYYGTSVVFAVTSTNSADFIGITDQAIADTATGAVIVQGGVSEKLSGLTVGADYYVQDDGSLVAGATSIPFDISGASFVQNFSVAAQDNSPQGIAFNNDGTKMFVVGQTGDAVYEYILLTGYDVSSASYSQSFSVTAQDTNPREIAFNNDGTKMFVLGYAGLDVNEYTLSTGFDLGSTVTFVDAFSVSSQETQPYGLAFNTDGTKMFIVGEAGDDVNEYTLSIGFDVSTASFVDSFSVVLQDTQPRGIAFNAAGTKMFIVGRADVVVDAYTLSTGFDVSSASFVDSFSVDTQENNPTAIAFSADGDKMFIVGPTGDDVNEYSTTAASTTVPAGRALSTTSILLEG
jgi:hypothetical protein